MARRRKMQPRLEHIAIAPLPNSVANEFLRDEGFCAQMQIGQTYSMLLDSDLSVTMKGLNAALRAAVAGRDSFRVPLSSGKTETAKLKKSGSGAATLLFGKRGFTFQDADLLSRSAKVRVAAMDRVFRDALLMPKEMERWNGIGRVRAFTDREYVELMSDLGTTPERFAADISRPRKLSVRQLVPDEKEYYCRLLAELDDVQTLPDFIAGALASNRKSWMDLNTRAALRRMAYSGLSHRLLPFDLLEGVTAADIAELIEADDPFSLMFAFELCGRRVAADASYAAVGTSILNKLFINPGAENRFTIFSACAVASTVGLRRIFPEESVPLWWFRLAALSHAGVLTSAFREVQKADDFLRWVADECGPEFIWHTAIDRRDAPRWLADWIDPAQIRAEMIGRAMNVVALIQESSRPQTWTDFVQSAYEGNQASGSPISAHFPGPMDDFFPAPDGPNAVLDELEDKLAAANSISDVPNLAALVFLRKSSEKTASHALRLLEKASIDEVMRSKKGDFLRLCADIAVASRSKELSDVVLNRGLRLIRERDRSAEEAINIFNIITVSLAANETHADHRNALGNVALSASFVMKKEDQMWGLRSVLRRMILRDERLRASLSSAMANLDMACLRN